MTIFLINFSGLVVIALIMWWFWLSKPKARAAAIDGPLEVVVDNGVYTPSQIETVAGKPITLRFVRKDPSPCAEKVLFDDLGVSLDLPVGKPVDVTVVPPEPGEYEFTCQMHMYRGRLLARTSV